MFRRKRTRADPSLVDSLALSFGCSFVHSFIRSVSQYIIHVFIHSCCMHGRKFTRADPSLVDSLARLFVRLFVHSSIHSFIPSVSQYIIHVFICLFVRTFIHPFISSVSQSVSWDKMAAWQRSIDQDCSVKMAVYWPSFFCEGGGEETVIVANIQLSWPHTWPLTHFSWPPAPKSSIVWQLYHN